MNIDVPERKVVYVGVQGSNVFLKKGHVTVGVKDRDPLLSVPMSQVGQLVLIGSVGLSSGLREHALRNGVEVAFLSRRGQWQGRLAGAEGGDPRVRAAQYRLGDVPDLALAIARAMIESKLLSQRALLMRYQADDRPELADLHERLRERAVSARDCVSIDALRGFEGSGSADFYQGVGLVLRGVADFTARERRPPPDPVNAVLSYASTLLTSEADAACSLAGLDPSIGVFHTPGRGKPAQALDLMEEFRPLLVERLAIEVFRQRVLGTDDFVSDGGRGVLLSDAARRRFIDRWEHQLLRTTRHRASGRQVTYRRTIELQARLLATTLHRPGTAYSGMVWR